ncbi:branched-chain amino acid ABC transporter ATP-binding protein/permease [Bradyrhizobium sp. 170]|nr:branched-chain amino acid ABC transporter ATP-binding protein/permease [Bradyrhizobium sp. 170]
MPAGASQRRSASQAAGLLALPWLFAIALVVAGPWILDAYTVNILIRAFFVATVALTVDALWGHSGYLTFGQSAFFGLGAYVLAIVFMRLGFGPAQVLTAVAITIGGAAALAAFVGWLSFYSGSTPLYASVISLVLPIVMVQLLYSGGEFTGSSSGLVGFESFELSTEAWFRIAGLFALTATLIAKIGISSDAGRLLGAIRDNEMRCAYLGLDTARIRIALLVLCAIVAALAGSGYAGFGGIAAPENASFTFGTQLVIMVALGGRGTLVGAIAGALLIETASAYLSGSLPFVWELIIGVSFIVVIVVLPRGLFGGLRDVLGSTARAKLSEPSAIRLETAGRTTPISSAEDVVVEVAGLSRSFGSLSVLSDVSFSARRGELVSLVGPNGAGKTTLIRCLADGGERSDGSVKIMGRSINRLPPHRIVALGLGRKFQAASVFETLSVADCLRVARTRHERPSFLFASNTLALPTAARAVLETSGLAERLHEEARFLSHGLKQALELAMVLALEPEVVLLDEPTAGLTRAERHRFAELLTALASVDRLCVLIVEHDLDFVREISSRIIVLHQGRIALDGTVEEVVDSPLVQEIYSGHRSKAAGEVNR